MNIVKDLDKLKNMNIGKRANLSHKKNASGTVSLTLDYREDGKRIRKALDIILTCKDKDYYEDKEKITLAINLRDEFEKQLNNERLFGKRASGAEVNFIDYFDEISQVKKHDSYLCSFKKYSSFVGKDFIPMKNIDNRHCASFARYLENSGIKQNTASLYFKKFKAVLNQAIDDELIESNPAQKVIVKTEHSKREFLTIDEFKLLAATPMKKIDTKNAFLFACFTGLRLSDLQALRTDDMQGGMLYVRQKKTREPLRIKLSKTAIKVLKQQPKYKDGLIFHLSDRKVIGQSIKRWIKRSGITKNITFHSSRHTFATLLLDSGADIYAVSKLIGHRDLKTTQRYAQLVDKKKDEAIDLLPNITL